MLLRGGLNTSCRTYLTREISMTHILTKVTPALLLLGLAGCATMGTGTGSTSTGTDPVNFTWHGNSDSVSGTMSAAFASGVTYSGQFFQITSDTSVDSLGPLWTGWGRGWRGGGFGGYWDAGPDFVKKYTGRVLANLTAPDGKHMRCRFQLARPSSGMSGGGSGECQVPDGKTIDASFPVG
jgi:hypothetical protein